jgi:hypothetical protein
VQIAAKYNCEVLMSLLLIAYTSLTPTPHPLLLNLGILVLLELGVFGALASTKKTTMELLKVELLFFLKSCL